MLKKIAIGLVVILILLLIGAVILYIKRHEIVRVATERVLSHVLEVDVSVGGARVEPLQGTVTLRDIVIPNPEGYDSDHAMRFGEVHVEADIQSFLGDRPAIGLIRITDPDFILERHLRTSNFRELIASAARPSGNGEATEEAPEESQKAFRIDRVEVASTTVSVTLPATGGESVGVEIPDVVIENLGTDTRPVMPAEAIERFLTEILSTVTRLGGDALGDLESLGEQAIDEATGAVEGAVDELRDNVRENVREGIGGILDRH
ncbi:hypothetical protein JXA47_00535 [Candidatus Sumerlaeota bacterium]|nr:hypothetical protein [Candidatus Sumerlaeota bacterium]